MGIERRRVGYTWVESVGGAPGVGRGEENPFPQLHLCTAAVALATVAGFLSFVPGGAVVREAVLAETLGLLMPGLGGVTALVGSVLLRLVWLLSELAISGILYFGPFVGGDSRRRS